MLGKKKSKSGPDFYPKAPESLIRDSHPELKRVVDSIFDNTKSLREEMTKRLNEYRNKIWDDDELEKHRSKISFNFLFAIVSTIAALVTDSKPKARVVPEFPFFNGVISEAYNRNLDYIWDALEVQDKLYKIEIWSLVAKLGIAEVGYKKGEGKYGLYMDIIDPRDFFIAPGYDDIWDAPFCGVRENVPVSVVKELFPDSDLEAEVFFNVDKDNKAKDEELKYTDAKESFMYSKAGMIRMYRVWMRTDEILDKEDEGVRPFPNGIMVYYTDDQYLGMKECEYSHGRAPFISLGDYYNPGMFDSIGEGDQISAITKEINLQLQAMMERAKRASDQPLLADSSQLGDAIEQIKLDRKAGKTGQIYSYDSTMSNTGRPPVVDFYPNETDATSWTIVSSFKGIIEYILGYTDMLRGETGKSERQSAVEVSILSEASSVRIRPKIRSLERFIKRLSFLFISLMQQYWIGDHWMYSKTDKGDEYFNFSSSREAMRKMIIDDETIRMMEEAIEHDLADEFSEADHAAYKDYLRFVEWANEQEYNPNDGVMFPFEIEVQADSSLPLDKQSKANLFLRLYAMKAVDREALLDALEIQNKDEIIKRMGKLDKLGGMGDNIPKKPTKGGV